MKNNLEQIKKMDSYAIWVVFLCIFIISPSLYADSRLSCQKITEEHLSINKLSTGICDKPSMVQQAILHALGNRFSCHKVTEEHLRNIVQFHVTGYELTELSGADIRGLSNVQKFVISKTSLEYLSEDILQEMPNLQEFRLINNDHFMELPREIFNGRSRLEVVDLSNNPRMTLQQGTFVETPNLKKLFLSNSPKLIKRLEEMSQNIELEEEPQRAFQAFSDLINYLGISLAQLLEMNPLRVQERWEALLLRTDSEKIPVWVQEELRKWEAHCDLDTEKNHNFDNLDLPREILTTKEKRQTTNFQDGIKKVIHVDTRELTPNRINEITKDLSPEGRLVALEDIINGLENGDEVIEIRTFNDPSGDQGQISIVGGTLVSKNGTRMQVQSLKNVNHLIMIRLWTQYNKSAEIVNLPLQKELRKGIIIQSGKKNLILGGVIGSVMGGLHGLPVGLVAGMVGTYVCVSKYKKYVQHLFNPQKSGSEIEISNKSFSNLLRFFSKKLYIEQSSVGFGKSY